MDQQVALRVLGAVDPVAVTGLRQPMAVFARLDARVNFGAADGSPADLVVLILAPEGEDTMLLRALSCVARRLRDRELAEKLRGAVDAEALHVVLTSDAWRGQELVTDSKIAA